MTLIIKLTKFSELPDKGLKIMYLDNLNFCKQLYSEHIIIDKKIKSLLN